jgi:putative ABC transport system ATP-binding protein
MSKLHEQKDAGAPAAEHTAPMHGAAISLRGVTKHFGKGEARVQALGGIDVDFPYGSVQMIVGPSGCGKTTLLSVIAATLDADDGTVEVLGQRLDRMNAAQKTVFRKKSVGFIFQQYNLLPTITAAENVAVPLLLNGVSRKESLERAAAALASVGLGNRAQAIPRQLSGGQQQRVAIARALVHDPALVVCDEPTAALDGETGKKVMEILRDIAAAPTRVVLIVTHDHRVFEYGQRFAVMNDGLLRKVVDRPEDIG